MKNAKRLAAAVLAGAMAFTMLTPQTALAAKKKKAAYTTRVYALEQIEKKLGATEQADDEAMSAIKDVKKGSKNYRIIAIAIKAGLITPTSNGKVSPKTKVTKKYVADTVAKITEGKSKSNSSTKLTKNSFKSYLNKLVPTVASKSSARIKKGTVIVNKPITLNNKTIKGDLIIADGVDTGSVVLQNVKVTGKIIVRAGNNTVSGTSSASSVSVRQINDAVGITVEDSANVSKVTVLEGSKDVTVAGTVRELAVEASDANVSLTAARIETVTVDESAQNTTVSTDKATTIDSATINAEGTKVTGEGKVEAATVNANDTTVATPDTKITTKEGVTAPKTSTETTPATPAQPTAPAGGAVAGGGAVAPSNPGTGGQTTNPGQTTQPTNPGTGDQGTKDPGTENPGTENPGTENPGTENPGTENPGTENPGTENPGTENPGTHNPGTENPGSGDQGNNPETPDDGTPKITTPVTTDGDQSFATGYPKAKVKYDTTGYDDKNHYYIVTLTYKLADNINASEDNPVMIHYAYAPFSGDNVDMAVASSKAVLYGHFGNDLANLTGANYGNIKVADHKEHKTTFNIYADNYKINAFIYSIVETNSGDLDNSKISTTPYKTTFTATRKTDNSSDQTLSDAYINKDGSRIVLYTYNIMDKSSKPSPDSFVLDDGTKVGNVEISDHYIVLTPEDGSVFSKDIKTVTYTAPDNNPLKTADGKLYSGSTLDVKTAYNDLLRAVKSDDNKYVSITLPYTSRYSERPKFAINGTETNIDTTYESYNEYITYYLRNKTGNNIQSVTVSGDMYNLALDKIDTITVNSDQFDMDSALSFGKVVNDHYSLRITVNVNADIKKLSSDSDFNNFNANNLVITVDGKKYRSKGTAWINYDQSNKEYYIEFYQYQNEHIDNLEFASNVKVTYSPEGLTDDITAAGHGYFYNLSGAPVKDGTETTDYSIDDTDWEIKSAYANRSNNFIYIYYYGKLNTNSKPDASCFKATNGTNSIVPDNVTVENTTGEYSLIKLTFENLPEDIDYYTISYDPGQDNKLINLNGNAVTFKDTVYVHNANHGIEMAELSPDGKELVIEFYAGLPASGLDKDDLIVSLGDNDISSYREDNRSRFGSDTVRMVFDLSDYSGSTDKFTITANGKDILDPAGEVIEKEKLAGDITKEKEFHFGDSFVYDKDKKTLRMNLSQDAEFLSGTHMSGSFFSFKTEDGLEATSSEDDIVINSDYSTGKFNGYYIEFDTTKIAGIDFDNIKTIQFKYTPTNTSARLMYKTGGYVKPTDYATVTVTTKSDVQKAAA